MPGAEPAVFSALPGPVRACLKAAGPGLRAAAKKDPAAFVKDLLNLLASAAAALGCRGEEALFLTGFAGADPTPGRLDAALAELRAVLFLRSEGFKEICALPCAAGKTADLRARRGGEDYLFEVRWVRGGFDGSAALKLSAKCRRKAAQLRAGLKKTGAARGGIIFAGEPLGFGRFSPSPELAAAAAAVTVPPRSGRAGNISVCLIRGDEAAVFPPWGGQ